MSKTRKTSVLAFFSSILCGGSLAAEVDLSTYARHAGLHPARGPKHKERWQADGTCVRREFSLEGGEKLIRSTGVAGRFWQLRCKRGLSYHRRRAQRPGVKYIFAPSPHMAREWSVRPIHGQRDAKRAGRKRGQRATITLRGWGAPSRAT